MISETTKVFMRNSGLVWRILPYMLGCILIVGGIAVASCYSLFEKLADAGFFTQLGALLNDSIFNVRLDELFNSLSALLLVLGELIAENIAVFVPLTVLLVLIISIGMSFFMGLAELAIADCLYSNMASNSRLSFGSCFIKNLGKSAKLQLTKLLIVLPVDLLIVASIIGVLLLYTVQNAIITFITPFILVLVLVVLIALRQTLFCMWASCMTVHNRSAFGALKESFVCMSKNFGTILSSQLVMTLIYVGVNIATCLFTASVGLLLTIPATILFSATLGQVAYFSTNGLKFYIDENKIISPKKKEDWEHLNALKDII